MVWYSKALLALCSVCLAAAVAFLLLIIPSLRQGSCVEHWGVVSQAMGTALLMVAAIALLKRSRRRRAICLIAIVVGYVVGAVSLAIGPWAWGAVLNSGSAYPGLYIGNTTLRAGLGIAAVLNVRLWLVEVSVLTLLAVVAARAMIRYSRLHG